MVTAIKCSIDPAASFDDISLRAVRYFLAVAEAESVSAAAEALCIPQPTLSQQIKRLEQRVGLRLFVRDGRGLRLTDAGQTFRSGIAPVPTQMREAIEATRAVAVPQTLDIGLCPGVTYARIADLTEYLRTSHPELGGVGATHLRLHATATCEVTSLLRQHRLALSIVRAPFRGHDVSVNVFRSDPLGVVVHRRHLLADRAAASWDRLDGYELLCLDPAQRSLSPGSLLAEVRRRGWCPEVTAVDDNHPALITYALTNTATVMLTTREDLPTSDELRWLPFDRDPVMESIAIVSSWASVFTELAQEFTVEPGGEIAAETG